MQVSSYLSTLLEPLRASEVHMRSGQNGEKPWETSDLEKGPGTPAAKYCLSVGRDLNNVLKSFETWSLKNTWNSGASWLGPKDWCFRFIDSIMFSTAMIVLIPTEYPKSATVNNFEEEITCFISSFSAIASLIKTLAASTACLCKT